MSSKETLYRFRPRFLGLAFLSLSCGVILLAAAATLQLERASQIIAGLAGMAGFFLGFAYLRSPVWRLTVTVKDDEIQVWNGVEERLRLPWDKVIRVVKGPERKTLYVDGGTPETSLLVPGPDAPAPYDIRNKAQLIEDILARVPADRVLTTDEAARLDEAKAEASKEDTAKVAGGES